jgi:hypothetical protein
MSSLFKRAAGTQAATSTTGSAYIQPCRSLSASYPWAQRAAPPLMPPAILASERLLLPVASAQRRFTACAARRSKNAAVVDVYDAEQIQVRTLKQDCIHSMAAAAAPALPPSLGFQLLHHSPPCSLRPFTPSIGDHASHTHAQ